MRLKGGGCAASRSEEAPSAGPNPTLPQPLVEEVPSPSQQLDVAEDEAASRSKAARAANERWVARKEARAHLSATMRQLSSFDDGLLEALQLGDMRLVRATWLRAQPPEYRIERRQDLETREGETPSPLLSSQEALALVCRAARAMGVLTYGWLTPGHPDPCGATLAVVRRALEENPHIEGLFWDFASLYQGDRSDAEQACFDRALRIDTNCRFFW